MSFEENDAVATVPTCFSLKTMAMLSVNTLHSFIHSFIHNL